MVLLLNLYGFYCPWQKVKVKFLNCLMVTCFFIAAKLEEDIEVSGSCDDHVILMHHYRMYHPYISWCRRVGVAAAPWIFSEWN